MRTSLAQLALLWLLALPALGEDPEVEPTVGGKTRDAWLDVLETLPSLPLDRVPPVQSSLNLALADLGSESSPRLLKLLEHKNEHVRLAACEALGELRATKEGTAALVALARNGSGLLRMRAVNALRSTVPASPNALPALVGALSADDSMLVHAAANALGRIAGVSQPARDALIKAALWSGDTRVWYALPAAGPELAPVLIRALTDGRPQVRDLAANALADLGDRFPHALLPALELLAEHPDPEVRADLPAHMERLRENHPDLAPWATRQLEARLGDDELRIVTYALEICFHELEVPPAVWEAVDRVQRSSETYERDTVDRLVADWRSIRDGLAPVSLKHVVAAAATLRTGDSAAREEALRVIPESAGPKSKLPRVRIALGLRAALKDSAWNVREQAAKLTGQLRLQKCLPDLLRMANEDPDELARCAALEALGKLGDPAALDTLRETLGHASQRVRNRTLSAIRDLGPRAASLVDAVAAFPDPNLHVETAQALGAMGPAARSACEALSALASQPDVLGRSHEADTSKRIRLAAIAALAKIGAEPARTTLRSLLGSEVPLVRQHAHRGLLELSNTKALRAEIAKACAAVRASWKR